MININESDIKILSSKIALPYFKLKIIDEIGVSNFLSNYNFITSKLKNSSKYHLLLLIFNYRKSEFLTFFKNINILIRENFELLEYVLDSDIFSKEVIKALDISLIKKIITLNFFNSTIIDKVYKIRRNDTFYLLENAVKSNNYEEYINYRTPDYVNEYVINMIDTNDIMELLYNSSNYPLIEKVIKYRKKDIIDYTAMNSNNIFEIKKILNIKYISEMYEDILNACIINDELITFVYSGYDQELKKILYYLYKDKVNSWVDSKIEDFSIFKYVRYNSGNITDYLIETINEDILDKLIKVKSLKYYEYLYENLYKVRRDDIINLILSKCTSDNTKLMEYLIYDIPSDIMTEILNNITLTNELIDKILLSKNTEVIKNVFKLYKEELLSFINNNIKQNRNYYIDKYVSSSDYPFVLQKELLNDLTDEEIFYIIEKENSSVSVINELFKTHKDMIFDNYIKILKTDLPKAKNILFNNRNTDLRKYIINNIKFEYLFLLINDLKSEEKEFMVKKYHTELLNKFKEEYDNDVVLFFKKRIASEQFDISNLATKLLTYDDVIKIISNNIDVNFNIINNIKYRKLTEEAVSKNALKIKNLPYEECLKFLKGLRENYDNLFTIFLENIVLDDEFVHKLFIERGLSDKQKRILFEMKENDIFRIVKDNILNKGVDPFIYVQKGTPNKILKYVLLFIDKEKIVEKLNDSDFINRKSIGKKFATKLAFNCISIENQKMAMELSKCYCGDIFEFLLNFETIQNFLKFNNIDLTKFFQYSLNSSYNFINDMVEIWKDDLNLFLKVKEILFKYVYTDSDIYSYKNFLDLVKNYVRYKDLCISLANVDNLDSINFKNIKLLFRLNDFNFKIKNYDECDNVINIIKQEYETAKNQCKTIEDYRLLLNKLLFNSNTNTIKNVLTRYGGVQDLLQLKYYNLDKPKILEKIDEVIYYTELMEEINVCDDVEILSKLLDDKINNIYSILTDFKSVNYEELMRDLYAVEMDLNLSKVNLNVCENDVELKEESNKYGVTIYDFRDKQYALLAHVISEQESIGELVEGRSSGSKNFISLSAISHRMQSYYYNAQNMILGYDSMPYSNFVCSSNCNMGSNQSIKNNSIEVNTIKRYQRGILEISDTSSNSEILSIRDGMIPKYIICPNRFPTSKEVDCALKYNLKIAITQPINKRINSPKKINIEYVPKISVDKEYLNDFKNQVVSTKNKGKIAVLTDLHGIFEPTLAILEDIRKKGITKIYSLGDNIGTGSNPRVVVDILNHYKVKSIKGNHELYLINGIDSYKTHLDKTMSFEEEALNTSWTNNNLSIEQVKEIASYDDYIELEIRGKKILLCHYLYDYNDGKLLYDLSKYDLIVQGHRHFGSIDKNIITLKAAGMGNSSESDRGVATYMIIDVSDDINYEFVNIPYSYKNSINEENISDNNYNQKIMRWITS